MSLFSPGLIVLLKPSHMMQILHIIHLQSRPYLAIVFNLQSFPISLAFLTSHLIHFSFILHSQHYNYLFKSVLLYSIC